MQPPGIVKPRKNVIPVKTELTIKLLRIKFIIFYSFALSIILETV